MEYVLELKNIYKSFPGVKVLEDVTLQVRPGEVHALMGENGAGKSTLMKILMGIYKADQGSIFLEGKETVIHGPKDAQNQVNQIEQAITLGVEGIIIEPVSVDGVVPSVKAAKEAGVNVVIVNQRISEPDAADCYVGADAATTGSKLMEEVMKDIDGKGNVALLLGPMGSDGQVGRSEGFDQVLADYPDVTVAFQDTAEWQTEPALTIVENWLNAGKEISAVVAQNDSMAVGAAKAIADAQKTGEIKVYGIDATSEGLQAVLDGKLQGTMAQGTADQGKFAADACADLLDGKEVDSETIVDNVYYTADNAQEALDAIAK